MLQSNSSVALVVQSIAAMGQDACFPVKPGPRSAESSLLSRQVNAPQWRLLRLTFWYDSINRRTAKRVKNKPAANGFCRRQLSLRRTCHRRRNPPRSLSKLHCEKCHTHPATTCTRRQGMSASKAPGSVIDCSPSLKRQRCVFSVHDAKLDALSLSELRYRGTLEGSTLSR